MRIAVLKVFPHERLLAACAGVPVGTSGMAGGVAGIRAVLNAPRFLCMDIWSDHFRLCDSRAL